MLPIYKAVSTFNKTLQGGSTNPWLVNVLDEGKLTPYVVKLFKKDHVDAANAVVKEVLGPVLGHQFDLSFPKIAFDEAFISTLGSELHQDLLRKDARIKFGSRLIDGAVTFTPKLHKHFLEKYELENIYAFDNLIFNIDRKLLKPNILFKEKECFLIDHELCLSINDHIIDLVKEDHWIYNYKNHIFYSPLMKRSKKTDFFFTFEENLKRLKIEAIYPYVTQLNEYGHTLLNYESIFRYLSYIKSNSSTFGKILRNTLVNE